MIERADRPARSPFRRRRLWVGLLLVSVGIVAFAGELALGAVKIPISDVVGSMFSHLGIDTDVPNRADAIVWGIRLPRALTAVAVGIGLGSSGAALQGTLRNRLADPNILGIGSGAALGAVIALAALPDANRAALAGGAVGGVLAGMLLRSLGKRGGTSRSSFVLVGVALATTLSAWVGFLVFASDATKVPPVEFWLLGSLAGSTWSQLTPLVLLTAIGFGVVVALARGLDLLSLGEHEARHLGVDVENMTWLVFLGVGIATGAAVGAVGVVAFVGLLAPHIGTRLVGPNHGPLLLASGAIGAIFVLASDTIARIATAPVEAPVGLVTAAVGGPFFLWLLRRSDKEYL